MLPALEHCNHCLNSCNETLRRCKVIKAFVELFQYDETGGFTKILKGSIATLMFLSEKRIISWASYVPINFSVFK